MSSQSISLGDLVRVLETDATRAAGFAGRDGYVFGQTTPSLSKVDVVGELRNDYAINVFFIDTEENAWFEPSLLDLLEHGTGITMEPVHSTDQ